MPSKEELELESNNNGDETIPEKTTNLLGVAADMEELVAAIKHNLRLKSKSCHSSLCSKAKRVSPYDVPSRTCCKQHADFCACAFKSNRHHHQKTVRKIDDPYEMLQVLLREGSLIKEAVKRLQLEGGSTGQMTSKKKDTIDFYEHDCSICDLPLTVSTDAGACAL